MRSAQLAFESKGREAGCDDYIVKFEPMDLLESIDRLLSN
jgi:hypothetical protein